MILIFIREFRLIKYIKIGIVAKKNHKSRRQNFQGRHIPKNRKHFDLVNLNNPITFAHNVGVWPVVDLET